MAMRCRPSSWPIVARGTRGVGLRTTLVVGLLCLAGHSELARAQPSRINARVVWAREDRAYLAAQDPISLDPGTILTFSHRGKKLAIGEVTAVHDGVLIAARVTSGSLKGVKRLERLEVAAERPVFPAAPVLRVGYPARSRSNLLFACGEIVIPPRPLHGAYRADVLDERSYRLVRDSIFVAQAPWPDTLLIRLFDEVADEEIALERGELDVAVFWPGEPSPHIREVARWQGSPSGTRNRGFLAATAMGAGARRDSFLFGGSERRSLASLNQELFRGDLTPCAGSPAGASQSDSAGSFNPPGMTRFEVDSSCPGRHVLERLLNREGRSVQLSIPPRIVRVSYVDAPISDSGDSPGTTCLFLIRCPVISAPTLRPYLNALGPDAFANMFECGPAARRP